MSRRKGIMTHKGTYVGRDCWWRHQVLHSTPERGPQVVSLETFLDGKPLLVVVKPQTADRPIILQRLQPELWNPTPWGLATNNRQHVANRVAQGKSSSEGVTFFMFAVLAGVAVLAKRA